MTDNKRKILLDAKVDIENTMRRMAGNEEVFNACLAGFLDDPSLPELNVAAGEKRWKDAFAAAHALKGVAGNMGFNPLFEATCVVVEILRAGGTDESLEPLVTLNQKYDEMIKTINLYFKAN